MLEMKFYFINMDVVFKVDIEILIGIAITCLTKFI